MNSDIQLSVFFRATYLSFWPYLFIFKCLLYFNSKQVAENTIVGSLGRTARRSNVSDYEHRRHQHGLCLRVFQMNKAAITLKCNIRLKLHFKLQNRGLKGQVHTSYL